MKIALLNLPIDANYGGNLQRYALITILQRLGHEVEHIQLYNNYRYSFFKSCLVFLKRLLLKIAGKHTYPFFYEMNNEKKYYEGLNKTLQFYNKFIPHTKKKFYSKKDFLYYDWSKYDAFVVGSDQVWRPNMTKQIGLENYFFKFIENIDKPIIAYGVSFGKEDEILPQNIELKELYNKFSAVSVREDSGLDILAKAGMNNPRPVQVLDPTMLLTAEDYKAIMEDNKGINKSYMFCYILDMDDEKCDIITKKAEELGIDSIIVGLDNSKDVSIGQWLNYIYNAENVITDSYHGYVFSVNFGKKVQFLGNKRRGNSRIESINRYLNFSKGNVVNTRIAINEKIKYSNFFLGISFK